jgi:two-component system, chemotaxis family, protein-glutamate methylesterase/glutaminase
MISIITIAASAGGLAPLQRIVSALPERSTAALFVVQHIGAHRSVLPEILNEISKLSAAFAHHQEEIRVGRIYVAPPDCHMRLAPGRIRLDRGPKVKHSRPAADPLFISAAESYREQVAGIVLSGWDGDGSAGLRAIKEHGGLAFVERPDEAEVPDMPRSAIAADHPDACLSIEALAAHVAALCSGSGR